MTSFRFDRWDSSSLGAAAKRYAAATPFPHIEIDNFLEEAVARRLVDEFPAPTAMRWTQYRHVSSRKLGCSEVAAFPPSARAVVEELNSPRFIEWLCCLTGIPDLHADPSLEGGGMHQIEAGGYLNVHADFTRHYRKPGWRRRVNLLIYLNDGWREEWGGQLELWDGQMFRCQRRISPLFNRAVIFSTSESSYHGHPDPLTCPRGVTRKSLALYYYSDDPVPARPRVRPTDWQYRPQDPVLRKILVRFDRGLLGVYSHLRRRFGLSDRWISRILSRK